MDLELDICQVVPLYSIGFLMVAIFDSCTCDTFRGVDSICSASSARPPTQALPTGRPAPGYKGSCTHRTYAMKLYTPGQFPVVDGGFRWM